MEERQDDFDALNVFYITSRSIDDALEESVSGEIFLFITTCELESGRKGTTELDCYKRQFSIVFLGSTNPRAVVLPLCLRVRACYSS